MKATVPHEVVNSGLTSEFRFPTRLRFGAGCASFIVDDIVEAGYKQVSIIYADVVEDFYRNLRDEMHGRGVQTHAYAPRVGEPSIADLADAMDSAVDPETDAVIGIGGGSVLDLAKLVAAMIGNDQPIREAFGIGKLNQRKAHLICVPTTSGTGSEVSPNAILTDTDEQLKKGVVSPWLLPDASYIDPALTVSLPPAVTASTGVDALTHCIEAYANRFAHPLIDPYALQGVRLIAGSLERAYSRGDDLDARSAMALGSMYGGLCLGPVNTAAVHALAYPLGGEYHIAHGLANAVLLPHVLAFNLEAAPQRYADIAIALGAADRGNPIDTARAGITRIRELNSACGIPGSLRQIGIPAEAAPRLAEAAMKVQRLLVRNVREVTVADAEMIYRKAMK
ncbi:MAG: iron-containing alcohol dehydrogenase [Phycisphaerales bacterium]